jgi:hypothetical protein
MARTFYIVPDPSHTFGHHHFFYAWAALSNPDDSALLSVEFHGSDEQESFESQECVQAIATSGPISSSQLATLSYLGLQSGATLKDVIAAARHKYPAM